MVDDAHLSRHRLLNSAHTAVLLLGMAVQAGVLGALVAGWFGAFFAIAVGLSAVAGTFLVRPRAVLRMYGGQAVHPARAPGLYRLLGALAHRADLPVRPALYRIPSAVPNALSVGSRGDPAIAVTDGLLRTLHTRELAGVLAHEVAHIDNGDLRVMAIADGFARVTASLGQFGVLLMLLGLCVDLTLVWVGVILALGPSWATLLMLGLSRRREYAADLRAVEITGDPRALASALQRIEHPTRVLERLLGLPGRDPNPSLLRTHPATHDRIQRLLAFEQRRPELLPEVGRLEYPEVQRRAGLRPWGTWY